MKRYLYYIILSLFLAIPAFVWSDPVPIEGGWSEGGLRSAGSGIVPFSVEKEGNTLYVFSCKQVKDVLVRIVSVEGIVFHEEVYTFSANETIAISLNNLPAGDYIIDFYHRNGYLSGGFVNP